MNIPEMSMEPPEGIQVGVCPVCDGELYQGDPVWEKDGECVCEWHLGADVAKWMGWRRSEAGEDS